MHHTTYRPKAKKMDFIDMNRHASNFETFAGLTGQHKSRYRSESTAQKGTVFYCTAQKLEMPTTFTYSVMQLI